MISRQRILEAMAEEFGRDDYTLAGELDGDWWIEPPLPDLPIPNKKKRERIMARAIELSAPTAKEVKAEARRRIAALDMGWMIERELTGGKAIPADLKAHAQAIRAAAEALEALDTIPADFASDAHWPQPFIEAQPAAEAGSEKPGKPGKK